jgi:nickel-dependent lactate racemase
MKTVPLQCRKIQVSLDVPADADVFLLPKATVLTDASVAIDQALKSPIASATLDELACGCKSACVVVSDSTRPIPYKGPDGILTPIIAILKNSGVVDIYIIIACGTHRAMEQAEIIDMLGVIVLEDGITVINHVATDKAMLRRIGKTDRNDDVIVNSHYLDADLKILTGLVEPHFMAGFSGGRKSVCPGICGREVTYGFHSASILNEPQSASMNLDANSCHEESLRIARMAGVDFIVNVTVDSGNHLTGVFCGDLEAAHLAAVEHIRKFSQIDLNSPYDLVITQAGDVGRNHYQCAKAAVAASRALKPGGDIIVVGDLIDSEMIGGENYKLMLKLFAELGHEAFMQRILSCDWTLVPDQWQVQMWAKAYEKMGPDGQLFICAGQLENCNSDLLCGVNVSSRTKRFPDENPAAYITRMTQQVIDEHLRKSPGSRVLVLPDGPFAVPVLASCK